MKKYKGLYEEEKQRHEEALQRYQEDHMDKMEIINLHKKCNKRTRKAPQSKKALSKSDEPKKVSGPNEKGQGSKRASSDRKKTAKKAGTKLKKTSKPKKQPKSPEFIDSSEEEEEWPPKNDRGEKMPPLLWVKEEDQSFFDLQG